MRKCIILLFILSFIKPVSNYAQQVRIEGSLGEMIAGPLKPSEQRLWLDTLKKWRANKKEQLNYNDREYRRPELSWIKTTFIYAQMMAHDRYFFDPVEGKYTVDRYLADLNKRYGGLDAVLIWPTYPNIGIDNRNQFDLVSDMPGGKEGVRQMIKDFHKRGVRVFFPIMIWDHGTRKIATTIPRAITQEMKDLGADGLNGDTMTGVTQDFRDAYREIGFSLALQPEVNLSDLKMVEWNRMSWGYYFPDWGVLKYAYVPGVSTYKWLEPRHQVHITDRWAINKTENLQYAFFNGIGYNSWENIWGIWNQVPVRYAEAIRRIRVIYRQFIGNWNSPGWEPHFPVVQKGIFASKFPAAGETVYTFVNRDGTKRSGVQIWLPYKKGVSYYDVWNGVQLHPLTDGNKISLSFSIEANGFGAIAERGKRLYPADFMQFLAKMKEMSKIPLDSLPDSWKPLSQQIVTIPQKQKLKSAPADMVLIPATTKYNFQATGVMIEGDELPDAVGVQYPWESHPQRTHRKTMPITAFFIDRFPVTNEQFKKFMDATRYHPKDNHNFLKDWKHGNYPDGWENKPVTWVSLEDARAYAFWAGKRLPHEWEWQYAAQGNDGRLYPWGPNRDTLKIPPADTTRNMRPPTDVNAYPAGASNFGVMDMTGNVWQWTDEYNDEHTRSAVLKGGSYYHPQTSGWYFPQAQEVNKQAKYLLMSPGMDRSAAIGFRCVADN